MENFHYTFLFEELASTSNTEIYFPWTLRLCCKILFTCLHFLPFMVFSLYCRWILRR